MPRGTVQRPEDRSSLPAATSRLDANRASQERGTLWTGVYCRSLSVPSARPCAMSA